MAWFRNFYKCSDCGGQWTDDWSSMCDDDCPYCGARHMSPYKSTDVARPRQNPTPSILKSVSHTEGDAPLFRNFYLCEHCDSTWTDIWSAMCDDDCPHCGARHMSPYKSEDYPGDKDKGRLQRPSRHALR